MQSRPSKKRKPRVRIGFPAYSVFPPSDVLASHLLALMSGYNDIVRLSDWLEAHQQIPKDELAKKIDDNRRSMQWRFILGILSEIRDSLNTLKADTTHFQRLWDALNNDGRTAFQAIERHLTWNSSGKTISLAQFLNAVRNRGAFHYIHAHFREGLTKLRQAFGDTDDGFIIEGTLSKGRMRFSFADTVRNAAAFGADLDIKKINVELDNQISKVPEILGLLNTFLQEAFAVQFRTRNLLPNDEGNGHWYLRQANRP